MQIKKYQNTPGPITKTYNINPDYWDEHNDEYWKDAGWRFMPYGEYQKLNPNDKTYIKWKDCMAIAQENASSHVSAAA